MLDWRFVAVLCFVLMIAGAEAGVLWTHFFEPSETKQAKIGSIDTLTLDASRRTIMVHATGKFCSEPVPDAANTFAKEFAARLSAASSNEKAAAALKEIINLDVLKLFERSQGIQALRDGMYRLCEAYANDAITKASYEDHIADLTATLNFIVPLELCAKLNREIVLALTGASESRASTAAKPDTQTLSVGWADTFNKSELLTSKFTQACITLGSDFASKLAAQMGNRSLARESATAVERSLRPTPAATTSPSLPGAGQPNFSSYGN
jgi:hypothetical protein